MQFKLPSYATILEIHDIVIQQFGGREGVLHPHMIDAALKRPQSYIAYDTECDVYLIAAIILDSFARGHAFADGNKRTALIAMMMTYNLNKPDDRISYVPGLTANIRLEKLVLDVAVKKPSIKMIRHRLKRIVTSLPAYK